MGYRKGLGPVSVYDENGYLTVKSEGISVYRESRAYGGGRDVLAYFSVDVGIDTARFLIRGFIRGALSDEWEPRNNDGKRWNVWEIDRRGEISSTYPLYRARTLREARDILRRLDFKVSAIPPRLLTRSARGE